MTGHPAVGPTKAAAVDPGGPNDAGEPRGRIKILNPISKLTLDLRRRDAEYYVSQGRAVWAGKDQAHIRLTPSHLANQKARAKERARLEIKREEQKGTAPYYDWTVCHDDATMDMLRHIPMVRPEVAFVDKRRAPRRSASGRT